MQNGTRRRKGRADAEALRCAETRSAGELGKVERMGRGLVGVAGAKQNLNEGGDGVLYEVLVKVNESERKDRCRSLEDLSIWCLAYMCVLRMCSGVVICCRSCRSVARLFRDGRFTGGERTGCGR